MSERVWIRAQHQHLSGVSRPAGLTARVERARRGVRVAHRRGVPLRRAGALDFPPQELLLPGHAEGLPDLAVRLTDLLRRLPRRRRCSYRHRAGAHGRRHRQDHARRRGRSDSRRRSQPGGLQPRRGAADGDRESPGHPHVGAGQGLRHRTAWDPRDHRCVRREDGRGLDARRRERVGATRRYGDARHARRDQEHELRAVARSRHRVRDRTTDRADRVRRSGGAGDAPLGRVGRHHARDALEGRFRGLPVLP